MSSLPRLRSISANPSRSSWVNNSTSLRSNAKPCWLWGLRSCRSPTNDCSRRRPSNMRPRYLEVKNFLGHEHEQVALPESGIFFLSGESGAGKSSFIVDAIGFALFGSKATRVIRQEQLRHKDHQAEAMEVRALFEFDDG